MVVVVTGDKNVLREQLLKIKKGLSTYVELKNVFLTAFKVVWQKANILVCF